MPSRKSGFEKPRYCSSFKKKSKSCGGQRTTTHRSVEGRDSEAVALGDEPRSSIGAQLRGAGSVAARGAEMASRSNQRPSARAKERAGASTQRSRKGRDCACG